MHAANVLFPAYRFFQGRSSTKIVEEVGGGKALKKCWPPWLTDRENVRF